MPGWLAAIDPRWAWALGAILLALAELAVPGIYLIWIAIACAAAGIAAAVFALPVAAAFGVFAVAAVGSVQVGRRLAADTDPGSEDPLLNERMVRMIGRQVIVSDAIVGGAGRIRIGDGSWPATGPDLPEGARARIVAVDAMTVVVAPEAATDRN